MKLEGSQYRVNGLTHYERNKSAYIQKRNQRRDFIRRFIARIKRRAVCKDCGYSDERVLQFDHLKNKKADIAYLPSLGWSMSRVKDEIRKCDIVCANCHMIRTLTRR